MSLLKRGASFLMKKITNATCLVLVLALFLTVAGYGNMALASTPPASPHLIQISGATSGGTFFLLSNAIAQMLNTNAPEWFRASAQSTAGTPANIRLMEDRETDFAFGQAGIAQDAFIGAGAFEREFTNFRSVTYIFPNVMQVIVRRDANIQNFSDLRGRTFAAGAMGSATEINTRDMFAAFGMTYDEVTIEFTSEAQSAELMNNRQADGGNFIAALGSASATELMSSGVFELYSFSDEEIEAILAKNPAYFKFIIPAGTYANQDYDITTFAVANFIFVRADLDDEVVYQFIRNLYENVQEIIDAHPIGRYIRPENAVQGLTVPLHPGAERFLREIGAI